MRSPRWDAPAASPLAKLKTGTLDSPLGYRNGSSGSLATADAFQAAMLAADGEDALEKGAPKLLLSPRLFAAHYLYPLLRYITVSSPSPRRGAPSPAPGAAAPPAPEPPPQQQLLLPPCGSTPVLRLPPPLRPLASLLRRVLTPVWLSLALLLLLALPSWWGALARLPLPPPHARGVPVLAIPMSATRGATLLATLSAIDVRVETLLLCDSAPGVPELECVAAEVAARAARGELPVGEVRVVFPRGGAQQGSGAAAGPVYGVSECWNALAREAFAMEDARAPWMLVMNDDVGFSEGTLAVSVAAIWGAFKGKSLLLANDGLPGVGYAFSAYALTREGYAALGPFDENFYPAYYEVRCARAAAYHRCRPIRPFTHAPARFDPRAGLRLHSARGPPAVAALDTHPLDAAVAPHPGAPARAARAER